MDKKGTINGWLQWFLSIVLVLNFSFTSWVALKIIEVEKELCTFKAQTNEKVFQLDRVNNKRDVQFGELTIKLDKTYVAVIRLEDKIGKLREIAN